MKESTPAKQEKEIRRNQAQFISGIQYTVNIRKSRYRILENESLSQ